MLHKQGIDLLLVHFFNDRIVLLFREFATESGLPGRECRMLTQASEQHKLFDIHFAASLLQPSAWASF